MDQREVQLNQLNAEFTRAKPFRQSPTSGRSKSASRFAWLGEKRTKRTTNCFMGIGLLGLVVVVAGLFSLVYGRAFFWEIVLRKMSIKPNSERFESWMKPPVQPYLSAYAFNITNPEEVLNGSKPILQEVGPFVYKSETVKESIKWHDDNTMSYRPRKYYTYQPEMSKFRDEYSDIITVPNIPLWTAINSVKDSDFNWGLVKDLIERNGRGTPFIQVSVGGLLWGYEDDLPCTKLTLPKECHDKSAPFSHSHDDHWGDEHENPFEKKKEQDVIVEDEQKSGKEAPVAKKKAEYVDCKCHWGLFRDRNVTLRHPIRFHTGQGEYNLERRGQVTQFKGKDKLGWWKEGSTCDAVGGQDGGTLPVGILAEDEFDIFIPLMCRRLPMFHEKDVDYDGINTYRFIPPSNAFGTPDDQDPERNNPENSCYCLAKDGFKCFKSGLVNLGACKREDMSPPLALSMPHFYQADPSYLNAVIGLEPDKSKHEFYIDVAPDFGFPLAMRPRFQLNAALFKFSKWAPTSKMADELVIPFLWAEDGFGEPSPEMVTKIQAGLFIPELLSTLFTVICLIFGGLMVIASFIFFAVQCPACQAAA